MIVQVLVSLVTSTLVTLAFQISLKKQLDKKKDINQDK